MRVSLLAVCAITMFTITPWVPKLLLVMLLYITCNRYFVIFAVCAGGYWYLRPQPSDSADATVTADTKRDGAKPDKAVQREIEKLQNLPVQKRRAVG